MMTMTRPILELALLQGSVILLLGCLTAVLLRWRRRAQEENRLLWCAIWFAVATIPLAGMIMPKWEPWTLPSPREAPTVPLAHSSPTRPSIVPAPATTMPALPEQATLPESIDTPRTNKEPIRFWLALFWGLGASLMAGRLLLSQCLLLRLSRRSDPVSEAWRDDLQEIARTLQFRRVPRIAQSSKVKIPLTWGFFRPIIVIPPSALALPAEQRRFVLWHECQHMKRHDVRWLTLAQGTLCLHWINPLAWWALSRLRFAQEQTCDDAIVMGQPDSAAPYAEFLLQTARQHAAAPQRVSSGLFRPLALAIFSPRMSTLKNRLTHILNANMKRTTTSRRRSSILVLIAFVSVGLASLGWRTETQAHDATADSPLEKTLEATQVENLKFDNESPPVVIKFLQDELGKLNVNVVILREAQDRLHARDRNEMHLHNMTARQADRTEEARLKMLDLMDRFRVTTLDDASNASELAQVTQSLLETKIRVQKETNRIDNLLGLADERFMREAQADYAGDLFFEAAIRNYREALSAIESGESSLDSKSTLKKRLERASEHLAAEVKAKKASLQHRLTLMREEFEIAKVTHENSIYRLQDYTRKRGEYDASKSNYERQLKALESLRERKLNAELENENQGAHSITLDLHDVSLADAMTYALQLGGMGYRVRNNTVVIGTPADLESL